MKRVARFQLLVDLARRHYDKAAEKLQQTTLKHQQMLHQQADLKNFQTQLSQEFTQQPDLNWSAHSFKNRMVFIEQLHKALEGQEKSQAQLAHTIARLRQVLIHRGQRLGAMEKLLAQAQEKAQREASRAEERRLEDGRRFAGVRRVQ
jgi:flagellar export protein FliJ